MENVLSLALPLVPHVMTLVEEEISEIKKYRFEILSLIEQADFLLPCCHGRGNKHIPIPIRRITTPIPNKAGVHGLCLSVCFFYGKTDFFFW